MSNKKIIFEDDFFDELDNLGLTQEEQQKLLDSLKESIGESSHDGDFKVTLGTYNSEDELIKFLDSNNDDDAEGGDFTPTLH